MSLCVPWKHRQIGIEESAKHKWTTRRGVLQSGHTLTFSFVQANPSKKDYASEERIEGESLSVGESKRPTLDGLLLTMGVLRDDEGTD